MASRLDNRVTISEIRRKTSDQAADQRIADAVFSVLDVPGGTVRELRQESAAITRVHGSTSWELPFDRWPEHANRVMLR